MVVQRLKDAAEQAKIELSNVQETTVNLPFLTADASGPKHLQKQLTRSRLEQMIKPLVDRTMEPLKKAMADAKKTPQQINEVVLVGGSTRIPLVQAKVKEFFGKEPNRSVNADEVVALGAAVQGGVLSGDVKDILLLDVTPLTLGIETLGGVMTPMIPRNTTIPTRKSETFSTAADNQSSVEVHVTQGERPMSKDNKTLGKFQLTGIPPAPRGVPQIEVTFDIDANGILHVTAKDKATSAERNIRIEASSGLSEADIKRAVDDAQKHEAEDKARKEVIEARNQLDNLVYSTRKLVQENSAKVPEPEKLMIEEELKSAEGVLERNKDASSPDELRGAFEKLQSAAHKLAEAMYKQSGGGEPSAEGHPGGGGAEGASKPDDVIDAEFEDKS
jgi:molecular chaperone DnaK